MTKSEKSFQDAIAFLKTGRPLDAERIFRTILESEPTHVGALNLLAIALMSMNRIAEAETFAKAAAEANQNSDVTFYNYGLILKALKRPSEALPQFDKALALNSSVAEPGIFGERYIAISCSMSGRYRILINRFR
ncbi:MAG TPA: tetratricopeptide repeat protein [Pseudolabrys sp.]